MRPDSPDDLHEHGARISSCIRYVVAEAGIETREIEFVVNQVIQGVFESAESKRVSITLLFEAMCL